MVQIPERYFSIGYSPMGTAIPNMLVDNMPALGGILLGGSFSKVVNSMLGEGPSREGNMPTIGEIPNSMPGTDD